VRLRYPNLWWSSEEYRDQISERLWLHISTSPIPKRVNSCSSECCFLQ
jgi:hypothetical protein